MLKSLIHSCFLQKISVNNNLYIRTLCSYSKDLVKPEAAVDQDFLLQNLKNARSSNKVLDLVSSHHKIMNKKHLIQALKSLFTLQKEGCTNLSIRQILKHPDFGKICSHLRSQIGVLELNDTIDSLKVMSFMGVPSNSTIVQVLLQIVRHRVNELSLQQIIFVDFILNQMKPTPISDALLIALPIVFEIQLPIKMDRDNIFQLVDCLQYISKKKVSEKCVETIVGSILKCPAEIDAKLAVGIIWSITDMKADEFFEPLLNLALERLIPSMDTLSFSEIETTVGKLINKHTTKLNFYYNERLFDKCVKYLIDKDLGIDNATYMLRKFNKIGYVNKDLLDYVAFKANQDPNSLLSGNAASRICNLVISLAQITYKPPHWNVLKECIENSTNFSCPEVKEVLWFKFAASLCALDIYIEDVLKRTLDSDFINHTLKRKYKSDFEHIVCIYQAIKTFKPELSYLLPSKGAIEEIISETPFNLDYSLQKSLYTVFGGENYVPTRLVSKLGHQIDYAVMYRKGGFPVAFNSNPHFIEDIEVNEGCQLVIVLGLASHHYSLNKVGIRGSTTIAIRTLEAMGHTVVPISLDKWKALADFEKLPYLMQTIKGKLRDDIVKCESIC